MLLTDLALVGTLPIPPHQHKSLNVRQALLERCQKIVPRLVHDVGSPISCSLSRPLSSWTISDEVCSQWTPETEIPSLLMRAGNVFFLHMILMDSDAGLAMCWGHSVLVRENGVERLSRHLLDLIEL
jgi:hypothetical protein